MILNLDDLHNLLYWLEIAQDAFDSGDSCYAGEVQRIEEMLFRIAKAIAAYPCRIVVIRANL